MITSACFTTDSEHLFFTFSVLNCFLLFQNCSSTLFCLVQISPGNRSLLVDPHSFVVTMVHYFVSFSAFISGVCVFCASAAFCNIGNSRLILKLMTFAYQEAEASDTLPEVRWGCCLSKHSVFIASFLFFFFFNHCNMTWPLDSACVHEGGDWHPAAPWPPPGWPHFAARQCVMTLGISLSERAACRHLLSAFSTTLIFLHTLFGLIGSWPNITHRALPISVSTSQTFLFHQVAPEGGKVLVYSCFTFPADNHRGETSSSLLRTLRSLTFDFHEILHHRLNYY